MNKKIKIPKDLGIKIGTKEQAIWEDVVKQAKIDLEAYERGMLIAKEMLKLAELKINEEKEKFK